MTLRAKLPVLYKSRQYGQGDALPANDVMMVEAWLDSGAAVWENDEDAPTPAPAAKARPVTAEAGLPGRSSDGDPDALVGKDSRRRRAKK